MGRMKESVEGVYEGADADADEGAEAEELGNNGEQLMLPGFEQDEGPNELDIERMQMQALCFELSALRRFLTEAQIEFKIDSTILVNTALKRIDALLSTFDESNRNESDRYIKRN